MDKDTVSFNQPGNKFNQQNNGNLFSDVTVLCRRLVVSGSQFAGLCIAGVCVLPPCGRQPVRSSGRMFSLAGRLPRG